MMIMLDYWNGDHFDNCYWLLRSNGSQVPPSWFRESKDENYWLTRLQNQIMNILSGLVHTVSFVHQQGYLHNDLHGHNILLHFVDVNDDVYVGLVDWGYSCLHGTRKCYPTLTSANKAYIKVAQCKRLHVAPK